MSGCFFANWLGAGECDGWLIRAHLVKRQVLEREGHGALIDDPRTWVLCCGGPQGNGGHHGMLDNSRKLRIPREKLPTEFIELMEAIGMGWYLDKHFGEPRS